MPSSASSAMGINPATAILWASAFVIAAMLIVQAGRLPANAAYADTATQGSYTVMTASSGRGGESAPDELLYVIDSRDQTLLVYEIEDPRRNQVILRATEDLDQLFVRARR